MCVFFKFIDRKIVKTVRYLSIVFCRVFFSLLVNMATGWWSLPLELRQLIIEYAVPNREGAVARTSRDWSMRVIRIREARQRRIDDLYVECRLTRALEMDLLIDHILCPLLTMPTDRTTRSPPRSVAEWHKTGQEWLFEYRLPDPIRLTIGIGTSRSNNLYVGGLVVYESSERQFWRMRALLNNWMPKQNDPSLYVYEPMYEYFRHSTRCKTGCMTTGWTLDEWRWYVGRLIASDQFQLKPMASLVDVVLHKRPRSSVWSRFFTTLFDVDRSTNDLLESIQCVSVFSSSLDTGDDNDDDDKME